MARDQPRLARPLTRFVGRERELAEIRQLLDTTRLLTLTGPGGIGKTRLAIEVATRSARTFTDGCVLVELAGVSEPQLVARTVAVAFGIEEQSRRQVVDSLVDAIGERSVLLVLDNCEHLVLACAELAERLLHSCPALALLATSRERLAVSGETSWRVPSLSLPDANATIVEQLPRGEAVELFVDRARAVAPGFKLTSRNAPAVADICLRLDGVPLAIELAAAQVRVLAPEQLLVLLSDRLHLLTDSTRTTRERHHTLRATLDWSYELLTPSEQRLLERVAVFAGGWTFEAAEAVCGPNVLEPLAQLVDKSLVLIEPDRGATARYRLLETVRQYAMERLRQQPSVDTFLARHAAFFSALAGRCEPHMADPGFTARLDALDGEHANLLAALRWLIDTGDVEPAQQLGGSLALFWFLRGHRNEGRRWLAELLALPGGPDRSEPRAKLLFGVALMALHQGDYEAVAAPIGQALDIWHALGNQVWIAYGQYVLGLLEWERGNYEQSTHLFRRGLKVARAAADPAVEAFNLRGLALVAMDRGFYAEARVWAQEALALAAHPRSICQALNILGEISYREGQYGIANDLLQASIAKARDIGERILVAVALPVLGHVLVDLGDFVGARVAFSECLGIARGHGDRQRLGSVLEGFAHLAAGQGQTTRCLRLVGAAGVLREQLGSSSSPSERIAVDRWVEPCRAALGAQAASVALAEGRVLSLAEASALAHADEERPRAGGLSPREVEVVALVAEGRSNLQIAERLVISERTVESHVSNALGKLGLGSRTRLAAWAVEQHLAVSPR